MLAPFRVRGFRFQWAGDLAMSWAVEMEVLILGWYVLVNSGSVSLLAVFGALHYIGSLISPVFGVAGDRIGYAKLFWMTRAFYALLASVLLVLAWQDALTPTAVLVLALLAGIVRPSDMVMRYAVVATILPPQQLMGGLGIARITSDSARIAGALAGASTVAAFGMVWAYVVIVFLYCISFLLTKQILSIQSNRVNPEQYVGNKRLSAAISELGTAFRYVWEKPVLLGAMWLAFLVNLLAFPFFLGLLPYVAKHQYGLGQEGLSTLAASFAFGGLIGSIALGSNKLPIGAARVMLLAALLWFLIDVAFAFSSELRIGIVLLTLAGLSSSLCLTPLAAVMLRGTEVAYRGRVMGMRMLAIWGLPIGLLLAGPLIERWGFEQVALGYAATGLALTLWMSLYWRKALWSQHAIANRLGEIGSSR